MSNSRLQANETPKTLSDAPASLADVGQLANEYASAGVFDDYKHRRAEQTLRRQKAGLDSFADCLRETGAEVGDLFNDPPAWENITWGLVEYYTKCLLKQGYAIGSVNVRLSTVKTYAKLASQAGFLSQETYLHIKNVSGYARPEAKRIDDRREKTRVGRKKAQAVSLTTAQARQLMTNHPPTPQGRRDALLMCLLLDHGLRCGEVADLSVDDFDLERGLFRFYRSKVDKTQTHQLTPRTLAAAKAYFQHDALEAGPLMRGSNKEGQLTTAGLSPQKLTKRVRVLSIRVGLYEEEAYRTKGGKAKTRQRGLLSAHDCRHYWATTAARNNTPLDRLQDAGGWSSPSMPLRYVEEAEVANTGVNLD